MPRTLTEGVGEQATRGPCGRRADPATTVVRSGQALAPDFTCPVPADFEKTEIVVSASTASAASASRSACARQARCELPHQGALALA